MTTMNAALTNTLEDNQHGLAAMIGLFTGVYAGFTIALLFSAPLMSPATWLMMSSAGALGTVGCLRWMPKTPPAQPVLSALRYLALTLPVYFFVQMLAGSLALSGFALVVAAALTSFALPFLESDIEADAAQDARKNSHREAIERLAFIDRIFEENLAQSRAELAAFDRKLERALKETDSGEAVLHFELVETRDEVAA